jgi:hypothetical protein
MHSFRWSRVTARTSGVALAALVISAMPVLAVTCDDIRALTKAEQIYWAKRLNITPEQRQRIRLECYGEGRATEAKARETDTKGDHPQPVADRN